MKHLKLFFALFAMLALGVGNAWAENAPVNTVLWGENFAHFGTKTPSDAKTGTGTTIYDGASITYAQSNTKTKAYNEKLAGGTAPELLLSQSNQTWTISGIKTGGATKMTLTFLSNKTTFSVTVSSASLSVSGSQKSWTITLKDGQTVPETFDLTIKNTGSSNARIDNVELKVTVAGTSSATPVAPTATFSNGSYTVGDAALDLSSLWTSNSDGAVTYSIVNAGTTGASISGSLFTATAAGSCTVKASQAATSAYNAIETTATITVTAPTPATVTLSEAGQEKTVEGKYVGDSYTLPSTSTQTCGTKTFVGWSTVEIATPGDKPTSKFYEHGATVTLSAEQTFYAVYATEGEGVAEPEEVTWSYDFSSFSGTSVQYKEETHDLGGGVTINIKDCNINDQLRIYSSAANNGYVISNKLPGTIKSMEFNAGYKVDALVVYGSTDGSTWNQVGKVSVTSTSYKDYKLSFGTTNYTYFKLDVEGTQQIRVAKMSITYMSAGGVTTTYSDYTTSCGATPTIYNVTIAGDIQYGTVTASPTSAAEGATITLTVTPADGYMLNNLSVTDENSNPVTVTDNNFTMPASDVTVSATFKEIPAATLTLSKNGDASDKIEGKVGDVINLPTFTSDCVKQFVGWSANEDCTTDPEYKAGEEYTLAATAQTLYAVYAIVEGGGSFTITKTMSEIVSENGYTISSGSTATCYTTLTLDENITLSTTGSANCGSFWSDPQEWRLYQNKSGNAIVTATNGCSLTSVKFTFTNSNTGTLLNNGAAMTSGTAVSASGTSATYVVGNSGTATNGQIRITQIEVVYTGDVSYSNYSTTCSAALANPTFSLAAGKYTEAKSVTISAAEGTIYYTMDGTTPTASSTQYTSAIALNDCGEYTIKAIAISSDSQSDVVSATYTIKLPLTNSQAAPYTEAEAIAVYDGGCYDNQDVYVKGTVKTATFNSTYGNYTITLTNGFQFYRFLQAAETKFTEDIIVPGDVLVACGKLSKHQTTYQLAEGCYLVERIPYEGEKTDISNTEATAYTVDKAFELIADVKSDLTKEVYVKGLVAVAPTSNPTADGQMTYKISDNGENTGNVLTVYLGLNLNGEKFTSKNDVQQGDYVVVKGKLLDYNSTYELNKGNQLVQHVKAATISIADITMEVGETKTIAATITPDAAKTEVTYSIKAGSDDCITLSENKITAKAEGTATIVATIATAEGEYMGKTIDFTVTVKAKSTKEKVVILAEYEGQWYAMMAKYVTGKTSHLAPLPVTYFDGKLYNVSEEDKALIEWERAVVDGKATFSNNSKYLTGKSGDTDLTLAATACEWTVSGDSYLIGARTFLYNAENNWFRNFGTSNAGDKNYSDMPTVTAPVYATGDIVYTREGLTNGKFGTICLPYASSSHTGAEFYEVSWLKEGTGLYLDQLEAGAQLVAGKPYIFRATSTEIKVTCTGAAVAEPVPGVKGLTGTFTDIAANTDLVGHYIIAQNQIWVANDQNTLPAYRAYINKDDVPTTEQTKLPGRRRVCMGENAATGLDNITNGENTTIKVIENGQLIIIRNGEKFNAQGQKL